MSRKSLHASFLVVGALASNAMAQIANDDCANALAVNSGISGPFTSVGATNSVPAMPCGSGGNDIWFSCVAISSGTLSASTCTLASWDTVIEILSGSCGSLTSLGCNDDTCSVQSQVSALVTTGTTYYIRVGGWQGATGPFSLNLTGPVAASAGAASSFAYGAGCYDNSRGFYERFPDSSYFDLTTQAFTLINLGANYAMVPTSTTYVPPSTAAQVVQCLPDNDEGEVTVPLLFPMPYPGGSTSSLTICSNGYVSAAPGNTVIYVPSVAQWNASIAARWGDWTDYDGTNPASGRILFEQIGTMAYVSWDGVFHWNRTTPNFFQLQFDNATGNVTFVWGSMSAIGPAHLVGFAAAGGQRDRGNQDVSALIPSGYQTGINDDMALQLSSGRPLLNTAIGLVTDHFPATAAIGLGILSFTQYNPGLDLAALGMPGCQQYVGFDVVSLLLPVGGVATQVLSIPNDPSFTGLVILGQSVAIVPGVNALGALASNGVRLQIGNF